MVHARRPVALVYLWLVAACGPSTGMSETSAGSGGSSSSSSGVTSGTGQGPTTGATPTTGITASTSGEGGSEPKPAVCGDGVLDEGELCDDGDVAAEDGCNAACEPVAAIAWTYTHDGAAHKNDGALGVAVDATGRIFVVGAETVKNRDGLIVALSPDGEELWRRTFDGLAGRDDYFDAVVVDEAGRIFVAGYEEVGVAENASVVRGLDPDGAELWRFAEEPALAGYANVEDLALADGALYSVGAARVPKDVEAVVRRHDPDTGAVAWRSATTVGWAVADARGITATAERLVVVGYVQDNTEIRPLTLVLDHAGTMVSEAIQEIPWGFWYDIAPIGEAGDLVLVGRTFMPGVLDRDVLVRRVDADFTEKWSHIYEHEILEDMGNGVAIGPNEAIFVAGAVTTAGTGVEHHDIFAGRYSGDGALLWTDIVDHPTAHGKDLGYAAAAGPGFFVLAGYQTTPDHGTDLWVRRYDEG